MSNSGRKKGLFLYLPGRLTSHSVCCLSFPSYETRIVRLALHSIVVRSNKIMNAKGSAWRSSQSEDLIDVGYASSSLPRHDDMSREHGGPQVCSPKTMSVQGSCLSSEEQSLGKFCLALFLEAKLVPSFFHHRL